jgi:hypothetical protein
MTDNNYDFLSNGVSAYWPSDPAKLPDLLDFFITSGISRNTCLVESNYDLSSDHMPVITSMSTVIINKSPSPWLTSRNTDWTAFKSNLQENINLNQRIKSPEDLNAAAQSRPNPSQQLLLMCHSIFDS